MDTHILTHTLSPGASLLVQEFGAQNRHYFYRLNSVGVSSVMHRDLNFTTH